MRSPFAVWVHAQTHHPNKLGMATLALRRTSWVRWAQYSHLNDILNAFPEGAPEQTAVRIAYAAWRRVPKAEREEVQAS